MVIGTTDNSTVCIPIYLCQPVYKTGLTISGATFCCWLVHTDTADGAYTYR